MSISLPNGTLLANPSTQTQYTAAVTRILHLSSFPAELKTRDLQIMFQGYEQDKGGFRIKWLDDVNALVVFADAGVAKRAYLTFLLSPPASFPPPAKIRPYDRPDAQQIIQALSARAMGHRASMSSAQHQHQHQPSMSGIDGLPGSHSRAMSMSTGAASGAASGGMGGFAFPKAGRASISGSGSISGASQAGGLSGLASRTGLGGSGSGSAHGRSGSSSFSRSSMGGVGALNFGNSSGNINGVSAGAARLPTHAENLDSPNRPSAPFPIRRTTRESELSRSASSSDNEPIVVMDHAPTPTPGSTGTAGLGFGGTSASASAGGFASWKMPSRATANGTGSASGTTGGSGGLRRESISAEKAMREVEKALAGVEAR